MKKIEHVNMTVPNIDVAIAFLKIVANAFIVRKDTCPPDSYRWAHVGNNDFYFALQEPHLVVEPKKALESNENFTVNHLALIVENRANIEQKLVQVGYERSIPTPKEKFRKHL